MYDMTEQEQQGSLHSTLGLVAKRMQVDFEASGDIGHAGSKGTVRERDVQRNFLEQYVSGAARVTGSGELLATDGQRSGQCDLMLVDLETPPLFRKEDYAVVPVECCYVVVEVKSNLTTEELKKSWAAAKKVKTLPRTAYLPDPSPLKFARTAHGREWDHAFPIKHFVFGWDGATVQTLAKEMSLLAARDADPAIGIDAVCVLNRGVVSWQDIFTGDLFERQSGSFAFASEATPGGVLLFMVTSVSELLSKCRHNERFDIKGYVSEPMGQIDSWWRAGEGFQTAMLPDGGTGFSPIGNQ